MPPILVDKLRCNIIQFIQRPDLLNDLSHSKTQLTVLKSLYGLPLDPEESEIFFAGTGKVYDQQEKQEVTWIAGRRSGKTSKLAAPVALYEAFRNHGLSANESAFVVLIAPTLKQAAIAFGTIKEYIRNSTILSQCVLSDTRNEIKLRHGVVITCLARNHENIRGRTIIVAILDEIAFWHDGSSGDSVAQVIEALRPAMSTAVTTKIIKMSTPFGKRGVLYYDFAHRAQLDYPVWQVRTALMNPTVTRDFLAKELARDEEQFRREYGAEFTDSIENWIDHALLDQCVLRDRQERPFQAGLNYVAALDPASRKHEFALAILHKQSDETIAVDKVVRWRGGNNRPLGFAFVLGEVKSILNAYEITSAIGDQYCCDAISQHLEKLGIAYKIFTFGAQTRPRLFSNMKHLLAQRQIELLDDPELLRQFGNLRQEKTERGLIDVRPSPGVNDDLAVAVALAASELCRQVPEPMLMPFEIIDNNPLGLIPSSCSYAGGCQNSPRCIDEDYCAGFQMLDLAFFSRQK